MYQAGIYCRISIEEQNKEGEYSAIVFTLRFRWQEIILQRIKILQRKKFM